MLAQARQRAALVVPPQAAAADNVCGNDRRKSSLLTRTGPSPAFVDRVASSTQYGTTFDALRGGWNTRSG